MNQVFTLPKLNALCRAITKYDEPDLLANHITEEICREFNVKACCIMLFDDRENQLFRISSCGLSDEYMSKGPVFVDHDYDKGGRENPILIKDMKSDPRVQYPEAADKETLNSLMIIPIISRTSIMGEIRVYDQAHIIVPEQDLDTLKTIGLILGLIIENQGLKNFLGEVKIAMHNLPLRMLDGK